MKRIICALLALCLCMGSLPAAPCNHQCRLEQSERDRIWNEIHFCIQKMHTSLNKAEREADKIGDVNVRSAMRAAVQGAICGLSGKSPYTVVIGACLGSISQIAGESYDAYWRSKDHVKDAEYYAFRADELQEQLWRDE